MEGNPLQRATPLTTPASQAIAAENSRFMTKVYFLMALGIAMTGLVAYETAQNLNLVTWIVTNKLVFWGLIIAELGAVIALSRLINRINAMTAGFIFFAYAALSGLTLSVIFLIYTMGSIANVFAITAFSFAGLSLFGYVTKRDLGPVGSFCTMGLFGLVGFYLLSIFIPGLRSDTFSLVSAIVGVIVFAGLTAYDTQKIKAMNIIGNEGTDEDHREAIMGALKLYLDFINLFLSLLRLLGRRK